MNKEIRKKIIEILKIPVSKTWVSKSGDMATETIRTPEIIAEQILSLLDTEKQKWGKNLLRAIKKEYCYKIKNK